AEGGGGGGGGLMPVPTPPPQAVTVTESPATNARASVLRFMVSCFREWRAGLRDPRPKGREIRCLPRFRGGGAGIPTLRALRGGGGRVAGEALHQQLGARGDAVGEVDALHPAVHGLGADAQLCGDLLLGRSLEQPPEHVSLTRSQPGLSASGRGPLLEVL